MFNMYTLTNYYLLSLLFTHINIYVNIILNTVSVMSLTENSNK